MWRRQTLVLILEFKRYYTKPCWICLSTPDAWLHWHLGHSKPCFCSVHQRTLSDQNLTSVIYDPCRWLIISRAHLHRSSNSLLTPLLFLQSSNVKGVSITRPSMGPVVGCSYQKLEEAVTLHSPLYCSCEACQICSLSSWLQPNPVIYIDKT